MGIDPSLRGTGLALLQAEKGAWKLIDSRVIRLAASLDPLECLGHLQREVLAFLGQHPVRHVAVEDAIFVQNFRTALTLGSARGALIGPLAAAGLPVFPYPPLRIKQSVIGYGRASKEQVRRTVTGFVKVPENSLSLDESDALAVALCHALTWRDPSD